MTPKELIKKVAEDIREGRLASFAPLISLFVMAGKELSLKGREPLLPFFKTVLPKRVTGMFGRQVSKSWTTAETSILKAGMIPGMNTLIVEPRFEQKKRFNDQILNPLLTGFKLSSDIIGKDNKSSMELKTFKNGNYLMLGNSYSSADSLRGTSGVSTLYVDECILSTSLVCTYDVKNNEIIHKKISEIAPNDILTSFIDDAVLYAVTPNGAQFRGTRPCYRITTKTGRALECTEGHIIPTNIGNMRLSQIVEYIYEKRCVDEKSRRRANHRDPVECDNGIVVGGCEYSPGRENIESYNVESRCEAARVQFTQVLPVTRARYKRTVDLAESRLRRLLVEIESESKEDVSLVVLDAVSCHVDKEDRDKRVSVLHNTPDSAGLVVHRRRKCTHTGACTHSFKETGCTREEHGSTATTSCKEEGAEICKLIEPQDACYFYDPIVSIEYIGEHDVYDLEVVGTHNFILGNGICVHNCQDINPDFLPVIEATTDASVDFGLINYFGTAKTSDGTLATLFSQSSQGHWCIKCEGCGKYNIASMEEQLFKMIGKKGCICAFCGKLLPFFTGKYVHKYPEKIHTHAGYHTPQIAFYIHCGYENKWNDLLYKMENWDKTLFYNEVLGIPDDESTRILTLKDLVEAQNNLDNSIQTALEARKAYDMVTLGVDWSGGGSGASTTAVAVIGKRHFTTVTDCIYMYRFKHGLSAEEEADAIAALASQFRVDYIAHDYTGAGNIREALLVSRHPQWMNNIFPVSYCYKPNADMVSFKQSGSRISYSVDKTKSLLLTLTAVRHKQITVPRFDVNNDAAVQRDLLAIIERAQEMNRGSNIYLLERAPGKSDDGAHALNIGFMCQCTVTNHYPVFSASDKYNMTEEQIFNLVGPETK